MATAENDIPVELTEDESGEEHFSNKLSEVLQRHRQTKLYAQNKRPSCPWCGNQNVSCGYFQSLQQTSRITGIQSAPSNTSQTSNQPRTRLLGTVLEALAGRVIPAVNVVTPR